MATEAEVREAFAIQARWCREMDASRSAAILASLSRVLNDATATGRAVLGWSGDPVADALVLRLLGGLHALHRAGEDEPLNAAFAGHVGTTELPDILRGVIHARDPALLPWLARPPQTNEVARSAALVTGLLHFAVRHGPTMELLEIGSSAGLNLALGRYRFRLGELAVGPADAPLTLAPEWRGPPPPAVPLEIVSARGVDLAPIDLGDVAALARLHAYVWAEHEERRDRLAAAVAIARENGVRVERGDAADWLDARLAEPQPAGMARVLIHSVLWQYLPTATRDRITAAMAAAGSRATRERPLGWVAMEPDPDSDAFAVRVRSWPNNEDRVVALTHPHARWIEAIPAR